MNITKVKKTILEILLIIATLVIGIVLGVWQVKPPKVDEASSLYPAYQRMMANIQKLATKPHPSGSAEIEIVRTQILDEIKSMGLTPIVENSIYTASEIADIVVRISNVGSKDEWWEKRKEWIEENYNIYSADDWFASKVGKDGTLLLQNILVKIDAPNTDNGVMFVSHYDSTNGGPGAADDMVSVCAMLETMRAQAQNNTLKNDIYFLFTDGEEQTLLGALKFVKEHPELKQKVNMVVNFEARGNKGGLLLFETSPKAYPLIKAAIQSKAKPIGISLAASVYAMMPNKTDLTAFLEEGYKGLNFVAIEGVETYHKPSDSYENLNKSTAWQYLYTTFTLADYTIHNDLNELQKSPSEAVFFPLLPGVMILMSSIVSHILCVVACVLALLFGVLQAKHKLLKLSFLSFFMGLFVFLSIIGAIFFVSGSYLFYIPLLVMVLTSFMKNWKIAYIVIRTISGIIVLLLWVPVIFLLWVSVIQPMMI